MRDLVTRFAQASDLHQSPMHAQLMELLNWRVEKNGKSQIVYRILGPIKIAKIQHPQSVEWDWLTSFRKKHHILLTYVEPGLGAGSLQKGLKVEPFANSMTSIVDLSLSRTALLASFTQKMRYNITRTEKRGEIKIVSVPFKEITQEQIESFFDLRKEWSNKKKVIGYDEATLRAVLKAYSDKGTLHFAYSGSTLVADLMILRHGTVATYYAAFAVGEGYKLFAPTLLTWRAMEIAQKDSCTIFDFGGIYDPRYPKLYKRWQGFTHFKAGFNPTPVQYPESRLLLGW